MNLDLTLISLFLGKTETLLHYPLLCYSKCFPGVFDTFTRAEKLILD